MNFPCGHPASPANTYFRLDRNSRSCRECKRAYNAEYRRRNDLPRLPTAPLAEVVRRNRPLSRLALLSGLPIATVEQIAMRRYRTVLYPTADALLSALGMRVEDVY